MTIDTAAYMNSVPTYLSQHLMGMKPYNYDDNMNIITPRGNATITKLNRMLTVVSDVICCEVKKIQGVTMPL